jgi:hypothetical protein
VIDNLACLDTQNTSLSAIHYIHWHWAIRIPVVERPCLIISATTKSTFSWLISPAIDAALTPLELLELKLRYSLSSGSLDPRRSLSSDSVSRLPGSNLDLPNPSITLSGEPNVFVSFSSIVSTSLTFFQLDIRIDDSETTDRVVFKLYDDVVSKTAHKLS